MSRASDKPAPTSGIELAPDVIVPRSALRFRFARSSGPGGQHVNKVATKARLTIAIDALADRLDPAAIKRLTTLAGPAHLTARGNLIMTCEQSRSQRVNREACLERLRQLIINAIRQPRERKKKRLTRATKKRRLEAKRQRSLIKQMRQPPRADA